MAPPDEPYLARLTADLSDGLARVPEALRAPHAAYLLAAQRSDGGWAGREGGPDLYYTAFALRGLAVLGALTPEVAARAAGYLKQTLTQQASVVDFFSLLYACVLVQVAGGPDVLADSPPDWPERVAATLAGLRTPDGGYAKALPATSGSTYHTFLVGLCYQLLGRPWPAADAAARFAIGRRRDDGGFVEVAPMRRGGTNPTAAAVGVLQLADALDAETREGVVNFLAAMPSGEGGLRANARVPLADLLSTFTGAWTLARLDALDRLDAAAVFAFARGLARPAGGFSGGLWDQGVDVEYTFYGLGVLALLESRA